MDVDNPADADVDSEVGKLRRFSVTKLPDGGYDVEVHRPALVSRGPLEMDKTYRVVTREYLAEGYDGFEALKRGTFVVDHENGQLMSAIVRKFLLGASYLWRMKQMRRLQAQNEPVLETKNGAPQDTLSKRTRIAITRARSLNLLKRAMKQTGHEAPSTPVKHQRGRSGSDELWRMVVDQSPGGFRDALHVGGSEHHSKFDSVSKRFNEPLAPGSGVAETSSTAATGTMDEATVESGIPAAKRLRTENEVESALFDPALASGLLDQIKSLLALVMRAAEADGQLYTRATVSDAAAPAETEEEHANQGANIALGSMAVDEGDADATLAFLTSGGSKQNGAKGTPTPLSQEIVRRATELRATFARLEQAAKQLAGGEDMGLSEQKRLLAALEGLIAKQDASLAQLHVQEKHEPGKQSAFGATGKVASNNFRHGAIASTSFHLDEKQMDQLRDDIKASAGSTAAEAGRSDKRPSERNGERDGGKEDGRATGQDDTSNLAFVSPLVDGRLVDVARQS